MLGPIDAIRASISFRKQASILRTEAKKSPTHAVLAELMEKRAQEADKDVVTWILGGGAAAGLLWFGWRK
jgi:hypothetical protein